MKSSPLIDELTAREITDEIISRIGEGVGFILLMAKPAEDDHIDTTRLTNLDAETANFVMSDYVKDINENRVEEILNDRAKTEH